MPLRIMSQFFIVILGLGLFFIGCSNNDSPIEHGSKFQNNGDAVNSNNLSIETPTHEVVLDDICNPDEEKRMLDGITIVGSQISNEHAREIIRVTQHLAPKGGEKPVPQYIVHEKPNIIRNTWRLPRFQSFQILELVDGRWKIIDANLGPIPPKQQRK